MSNSYKVFINGQQEKIFSTPVKSSWNLPDTHMPFVLAESEHDAAVEIFSAEAIQSVQIRPKQKRIRFSFDSHHISFSAGNHDKLSVEINGDSNSAIGIFLSPSIGKPEKTTYFFAAGEHDVGVLHLTDGDTLYLEKGAYVKAKLLLEGNDITVCGNGILSGENCTKPEERYIVETHGCHRLKIYGVTLIQSLLWNMRLTDIDDSEIYDIKIIGYRGNNDGIDVCGSRNVHVHDCFIRSTDDCLCVKGFNSGNVENILFERCTLWNDYANPMRVGGIRADWARHLVFRDIDIIHNHAGYPCFAVLEGNRAHISDLQVSDVRIEDAGNSHLFDIRVQRNLWNTDPHAGPMEHISFKNIFLGDSETKPAFLPQESILKGWNEECAIDDVTFENIYCYGNRMSSLADCRICVREFVKNVRFLSDTPAEEQIFAEAKLTELSFSEDGYYRAILLLKAENRGKKSVSLSLRPCISPKKHTENHLEARSFSLQPGEAQTEQFRVKLMPGKYLTWAESENVHTQTAYTVTELAYRFPIADRTCANLMPSYPIFDADGRQMAVLAFSRDRDGLFCYAEIRNESSMQNEPIAEVPQVKLFVCKKPELQEGMAIFSSSESVEGKAPAMMYKNGQYITEPIMRNYAEIQYTLNNAPRYECLTEISADANGVSDCIRMQLKTVENGNGYNMTTEKKEDGNPKVLLSSSTTDGITQMLLYYPWQLLGLQKGEPVLLEAQVTPVIKHKISNNLFTLNDSLNPQISVHMYGEILL